MSRVLLAWEFGAGLGHVGRGLALARRLRERGHEPLLAFSDVGCFATRQAGGIAWTQAPVLRRPSAPDDAPLNASDILLNLGFDDAAGLAGALRGWDGLLRAWKPALLVADYAPSAMLAARAAGLPRLTLGSGFSTFPAGDPMPSLRPWAGVHPAQLAQRDAQLVGAVARAFEHAFRRAPAPGRAAELFEADEHLVCTWAPFDPFGPREAVEYLGPQDDGRDARPVAWLTARRPRIFAYLKPPDARFQAALAGLREVAGEAIVAAPGLSPGEAVALSGPGVCVLAEAVALGPALREADLCMSHSGPGIAAAAAAHGVPQALLPMQLEQYLVARRLQGTGAARMLEPGQWPADFARWLAEAASEPARAAALALRAQASRPPLDAAERIARRLET